MIHNKRVLIWRFTLVLIKINYGQIGDQTGLFHTTNPVFYTSGTCKNYRISIWRNFKLVCCAKYDRGLDLGFWEILKPLKWANITSFFLIKTNG
jgi:hypothetical protein